ncbi:luciferase [Paractinoplanes deccanensis]|uniref:Luciferase n=1 Tax=Paractinoplanes deccanensis TaxID=113561 RepID=A0ABQ3YBH2_9ACTN|nr:LLM class flavin-dependent oxidoreductase [Actinoplanes deccanensis]GID77328.1 luciferase [Actinoplanes deccanensis]
MKIGIGLPNHVRDVDASIIPSYAARAERAGFATLGTIGRIAYPGVMDTVALAAAAGATTTIGLLSNVLLGTVWPPVLLAKEIASIDGVSGGRLTMGVGIGLRPDDFVVEGRGPRGLGKRIDADLEVYRSVWDGEPVGGGENGAVPIGARRVPMIFGGTSPASYRRMATWGDGYIAPATAPAYLAQNFDNARKAWTEAGRDGSPRLAAIAYFAFGDIERGRAGVADYYSPAPAEYREVVVGSIAGGAEAARAAVKAFADLGVDELVFQPATADEDEVERLAEAVL